MTHSHDHDSDGRGQHGPAHPGDRSSSEPGGFDEYDHPAYAASAAEAAADSEADAQGSDSEADGGGADAGGADAFNTEAVNDEPATATSHSASWAAAPSGAGAPAGGRWAGGIPVVSDGTAAEGDAAESPLVSPLTGDAALAAERLEDLRRLQAEYVNYKKRVDRDRSVARDQGISHVLESMLPVLDEIHLAREHGDLESGPAATIVDKLEAVLAKLGIERFGAAGDEFDPNHHEALMRLESDLPEGTTATTVVQVLQPGYRMGERIVRAARVAVADPQ